MNILSYSLAFAFLRQVLHVAITVYLSRLVGPEVFGEFSYETAIAAVILGVCSMGAGSLVLNSPEASRMEWSTLLLFPALLSGLVLLIMLSTRYMITGHLLLHALLIGVTPVFLVFVQVLDSRLMIERKFLHKAAFDLVSFILSGILVVIMSRSFGGVVLLVIYHLSHILLRLFLYLVTLDNKPGLYIEINYLLNVKSTGLALSINSFMSTVSVNLDRIILGASINMVALGYYSRSLSLVLLPVNQIAEVSSKLFIPKLSRTTDTEARLIYKNLMLLMGSFILLILGIVFINAESIIIGVLGDDWSEMTWILKCFVLISPFSLSNRLVGLILISRGRSTDIHRETLLKRPVSLAILLLGSFGGLRGIVCAKLAVELINTGISAYQINKIVHFNLFTYARIVLIWISTIIGIICINHLFTKFISSLLLIIVLFLIVIRSISNKKLEI